jgi:MFS family permease
MSEQEPHYRDPVTTTMPVPSIARLAPFAALQHRDFRLLWIGQLISQAGTQMQSVTINWHIYLLTNSALALGLIGLMRAVPIIVFSLIGGAFADTHGRRQVLLVTQSAMMLCAAILGLLTYSGRVSTGSIYLLTSLAAATMAFDAPARSALIPNLVPKEHLKNALSMNSIMRQTATTLGPGLAGFLIGWHGVAVIYWINAASFLAVIGALVLMKSPNRENQGTEHITLFSFSEGIRFVRRSRIILSTMMLDFFGTFFSYASSLLPIFAHEILHVGPQGLGILYAAKSVGAVITGAALSFAGNVRNKGILVLWAVTLFGAATVLYGASRWFALSVLFLALAGAADNFSTISRNTIRQIVTPDHLRGRVTSVNVIFSQAGPQLGNLEAGIVAALIGAPLSVVTGGIATLITVAAVAWLVPELRNYQD